MHKTLAILMLLSISGCYQDMCIEADDFGAPNVTVPVFTNSSAIGGVEDSEFVPWIDSGYILDGSNLVLVVKNWTYGKQSNSADQLSAWSPWYANFDKDKGLLPTMVQRFPDCQFTSSQGVSNYKVANPPCLMKQGKGLYAAIASKFYDINGSDSSKQFPDTSSAVALHLGETLSTPLQDVDNDGNLIPAGGLIFDFNNSENTTAKGFLQDGAKLYFKILDSYYGDNSGQYIVKIKSGVQTSSSDPITTIVSLVKGVLFGVTPSSDAGYFDRSSIDKKGVIFSIFDNIVSVPSFKNTVKLLLTLYIAFLGIGFTVGLIQINANDLMKRYFKICLLSILISENSWQFFYDYFFTFFIDGSQQIINLIQKAGNTGPGSNNIITLMLAPQTLIKLFSLLFVSWDGFIYIILYFICFCFLFVTIFKAYLVYLNALILMGIVIATGPIFLCFMLFKATEAFFKNWMQQLVSYSLQPVILFTGITFMSMIVRHQIYTTLGFKVCKVEFPKLSNDIQKAMTISDSFFKSSIFYWWIPKPDGIPQGTTLTNVLVPEAHFQTTPGSDKPASNEICKGNPSYNNGAYAVNTDASKSTYCQAYGCTEKRVAEFPFLDPNIPQDCDRLNFIYQNNSLRQNYWNILFLAVLIWLISKFNEVAVGIANTISGALNFGRAPTVDTQGAAERAYAGIKSEISNSAPANYARNAVRGLVQSTYDKTIGAGVAAVKDRYEQFKENQYPKKIQAAATADLKKLQDISGKMESFKQLGDGLKGKFADSFKDIKGKDGKALDGQGLIDALSKKSSMRNTEAGVKMKGGLRTLLTGKRDTKLMHNEAALAVYGKKFTQLSEEQKARVKGFVSDNAKEINQLRQMKKYSSAKKAFAKESQALKDMYASGKDYSKIELNSDKNLDAALKSLVKEARLDLLKPKADSKDSLKQQKSEELYKSNLLSDSNGSLDNVRAKLKDNLTSSKEKLLDDLARSVTSDVNASYGKLSAADAKKVDAEFKLQFGENNGDRLKYQLAQIKYGDYYDKLDGDRKRVIDSLLDKEGRAALD
ncbi:MAG: type IV secretion system protein, partial [Rickettsiaceae bacterium]|nr:type IV secretion system protein [Rickettsiaceae bacterium]